MANGDLNMDKLRELIGDSLKRDSFLESLLPSISTAKPSQCDTFIINPKVHEEFVKKAEPGDKILGMSTGLNSVRLISSPYVKSENWKIPLLSEDLDVSPEVREAINKTLMGFGKCAVAYAIDTQAIQRKLWEQIYEIPQNPNYL